MTPTTPRLPAKRTGGQAALRPGTALRTGMADQAAAGAAKAGGAHLPPACISQLRHPSEPR